MVAAETDEIKLPRVSKHFLDQIREENEDRKYFRELDKRRELQTIEAVVNNVRTLTV